jgi:hypothetical protein
VTAASVGLKLVTNSDEQLPSSCADLFVSLLLR